MEHSHSIHDKKNVFFTGSKIKHTQKFFGKAFSFSRSDDIYLLICRINRHTYKCQIRYMPVCGETKCTHSDKQKGRARTHSRRHQSWARCRKTHQLISDQVKSNEIKCKDTFKQTTAKMMCDVSSLEKRSFVTAHTQRRLKRDHFREM